MQMNLRGFSLVLVAAVAASSESQDANDVSFLQASLNLEQDDEIKGDGLKVKFAKKQKSPCRVQFDVAGDDGKKFAVEVDDLNLAVVRDGDTPERSVFFRDGIGHGEEIKVVKGEFFVAAEMDQELKHGDTKFPALLETDQHSGAKTTGVVHVGTSWNSNGTEALLQRKASLDEGHTMKMFAAAAASMYQDDLVPTILKTAQLIGKNGVDGVEYGCAAAFHMYTRILGKGRDKAGKMSKEEKASLIGVKANHTVEVSEADGSSCVGQGMGTGRRRSSAPWNSGCNRQPYVACGSSHLGLCSTFYDQSECSDPFSGCSNCACNKGCEYHDAICSDGGDGCNGQGTMSWACVSIDVGPGNQCDPCTGRGASGGVPTRRRRFWS